MASGFWVPAEIMPDIHFATGSAGRRTGRRGS
jgi:hypothetical protein